MSSQCMVVYIVCSCLVFSLLQMSEAVYSFQCPTQSHWRHREKAYCNSSFSYFCLFDRNQDNFTEICRENSEIEKPGFKLIVSGSKQGTLQGEICEKDFYQPFKFSSSGNSRCVYQKYHCSEEGQTIYSNGTNKIENVCRCDHSMGYDFLHRPKHLCFCVPFEEDCSCYFKICPSDGILSPDYECLRENVWKDKFTCNSNIKINDKTENLTIISTDGHVKQADSVSWPAVTLLMLLCVGFVCAFVFFSVKMNTRGQKKKRKSTTKTSSLEAATRQEDTPPPIVTIVQDTVDNIPSTSGAVINPVVTNRQDLKQNNKNIKLTKRNEYFEETKASIKVFNQVTNHGFVIISGPPGSGKSAIAKNTVLKLEESDAFIALFVSSPEEIKKSILPERKQVFVVYDVVGKYTVDYSSIQKWKKEETFIKQTFTDCSNTKLILTCRSYIYNSGFNRKLDFSPVHCDLLSCDLKLALDERRNICKMYNVPEVCDDTIMMYDFLPLLCSLTSREKENTDVFINPSKLLATEMTNSLERSDVSVIAIALLVVLDNNVEMQNLTFKYPNIEELLHSLCDECGCKYDYSTTMVLSAFRDLIGTYIRETEEGFISIHNELFHNLSFIVGSRIINCLLKHGSSKFLANRLILASINEKHDELLIVVQSEFEESYFERLMSDIRNSYHRSVLTGIQVKNKKFKDKLLTYLRRLKAEDLKCDDANSTPLHVVAEHGYNSLAYVLLNLKTDAIFEKDLYGNTPLHMACLGGHCEVVKTLLLYDKSSMDIKNNGDLTPLEAASNNGHLSTVDVLLEHVAKVNLKN